MFVGSTVGPIVVNIVAFIIIFCISAIIYYFGIYLGKKELGLGKTEHGAFICKFIALCVFFGGVYVTYNAIEIPNWAVIYIGLIVEIIVLFIIISFIGVLIFYIGEYLRDL